MKIKLRDEAERDLDSGYLFYEKQSPGLGSYFLDSLFSDIDSLRLYAGIHPIVHGSYRCLSHRFPYAIFYEIEGDNIRILAVFDCRLNPARVKRRLKKR